MLIKVKRIKEFTVRDKRGSRVETTSGPLKEQKVFDEAILVDLIKSIRPYEKTGDDYMNISDNICVIYVFNTPEKNPKEVTQIHVVSDYNDLVDKYNELSGRKKIA